MPQYTQKNLIAWSIRKRGFVFFIRINSTSTKTYLPTPAATAPTVLTPKPPRNTITKNNGNATNIVVCITFQTASSTPEYSIITPLATSVSDSAMSNGTNPNFA